MKDAADSLIDDSEGSVRQLDTTEKVHDGGERPFLEGERKKREFSVSEVKRGPIWRGRRLTPPD